MFCKPLLSIALVIFASCLLFSWGCCRHRSCGESRCGVGHGHSDWAVKKIAKSLDLNVEQKAKLSAIKDTLMVRRTDLGNVRSEVLAELALQAKSEKLDTAKLNGLFELKEAKAKAMHESLVSQIAEFHAMLTPEQKEKLAKHLEKINGWQKECSHR